MTMINKFLEHIELEKRYSPHTVTSYKKDLQDFRLFLMETEGTEDLTLAHKRTVRNFMVHLSENHIAKRSINRKISSLRSFYLFLLKTNVLPTSPMDSIKSLKFYPQKQIAFSTEEMEALQHLKTLNENPLSALIIETLYQTGIRKAELCNLLTTHVDTAGKELKITGKGNKERLVPISEALADRLQNYSKLRRPATGNEQWFFVNKKGAKLGEKFVYSVVNKYLSMVSTKQKKSPHILRHSFATHVLENGAEISKVKELLGHSSLASTQVYTNANIEKLKEVLNRAHPRAMKKN